ncbi:MAG: ATP-binding protein [Lachnospiraceae bacterium]|nr:ATP-binding protein [Lachnospiraceae bacterium]
MSLTNSQYDALIQEYDQKQFQNHQEMRRRQEELYLHIPEIKDLDAQAASISVEAVKKQLDKDSSDFSAESLHSRLEEIKTKKMRLMREANYPSNYLDSIYECPDCKDTGFIDGKKCHCFVQKIIDLVHSQSHLGDILEKENFDTFSFEYYSNEIIDPLTGDTSLQIANKAYNTCLDFVQNFEKKGGNLLLSGTTGTGKTFLSNCIAKALLDKGFSVIYFTADQFFNVFEKATFEHDEQSNASKERIANCDLLIIDDLGTEFTNSFTVSQLYQCLNDRLLKNKSTVISTNYNMRDFRDIYSERISSRITSNYKLVTLLGEDIRLKKI